MLRILQHCGQHIPARPIVGAAKCESPLGLLYHKTQHKRTARSDTWPMPASEPKRPAAVERHLNGGAFTHVNDTSPSLDPAVTLKIAPASLNPPQLAGTPGYTPEKIRWWELGIVRKKQRKTLSISVALAKQLRCAGNSWECAGAPLLRLPTRAV